MQLDKTSLDGVVILTPRIFGDARGNFFESYHAEKFASLGISENFLQDNQATSKHAVLRGLHYQLHYPQAKLVRVVLGEVFDVAVDIRVGSPSYGQYVGTVLSESNHKMMYIPAGFAHGYCVISQQSVFQYKCSAVYHPKDEHGIRWDDPDLSIDWPVKTPVVSEKDQSLLFLSQLPDNHKPIFEGED